MRLCDRCGNPVGSCLQPMKLQFSSEMNVAHVFKTADLCSDCQPTVAKMLEAFWKTQLIFAERRQETSP